MKKWMMLLLTTLLATVLVACNEKAEPTEGTEKEEESELTAEEVYTKALEASEKMESAEVDMKLEQQISSEADGVAMDTESDFTTKMTLDPLATHLKGTTKMNMAGTENLPAMEMEMYLVDNAMYVFSDQMGQWMKMEGASMEMIQQMAGQQPDPSQQLKMLKDYADQLSFEQSSDEFILKLKADGEKFNELIQEMLKEQMPPELMQEMGEEEQQAIEDMKVNSMSFELYLDKETYQMNKFNMDMDMTMQPEGDAINIVQKVDSTYSNINSIDKIEVPEEVKNDAVVQ
ncbi:DUF6612 family protein [Virgibacillus halodenitrificans]|uniref:Lipoprotein n=2 Tax=Virgibacillus halodenitrificans TaxID=1482 RepID=A0AAC9J034_VIRHA|nr:DUF6612 family protein [Virgibacillus halodenitrificans]APC47330.1 hypothetical protein BME96_03725 [Virgibacillus halodenitrificans]MCJ0932391.1 hypothetical protein [Virgibacillus halodenitrificans]MEC2158073.1 hypothetical protein [Virgibacillus halodenitrificans]WHX24854.1 hypothetical protein QNH47_11735 [Virgibacillus halodenitrificans]CDQ32133.1 hypothetical protein BN993_01537 [Virgibacillus halodenitrificans]